MSAPKAKAALTRRGVALILAVVAIAVLTAVATDFAYNQRVDLQLAANQRDALQAPLPGRERHRHVAAAAALPEAARLQSSCPTWAACSGSSGRRRSGRQRRQARRALGLGLNIQLWRLARSTATCSRGWCWRHRQPRKASGARSPPTRKFASTSEDPELASAAEAAASAASSGCFDANITDEEEKLNVNQLDAPQLLGRAAATRMWTCSPTSASSSSSTTRTPTTSRSTPQDVLIAMQGLGGRGRRPSPALNLTGDGDAFLPGFSDEDCKLRPLHPRYEPKNARFDTPRRALHGARRERPVHGRVPRPAHRLPGHERAAERQHRRPDDALPRDPLGGRPAAPGPAAREPGVHRRSDQADPRGAHVRLHRHVGEDFVNVVAVAGIADQPSRSPATRRTTAGSATRARPSASRRSVRSARSQKKITAVVRLDDALGRLLYWREE